MNFTPENIGGMGFADTPRSEALAEAVICQAIEDLWSAPYRSASMEFFEGGQYVYFARMAGLKSCEYIGLREAAISAACFRRCTND